MRADLEEKGDDDVFRKIRKDFDDGGVNVPDAEIRAMMGEFLAKAVGEIEAGSRKALRALGPAGAPKSRRSAARRPATAHGRLAG